MQARLVLGFVVMAIGAGCGKHETSAPHATVTVDVRGQGTRDIAAADFADGWQVRFDRFRLAPTFGVDETFDNRKHDGYEPVIGPEGYIYGGDELELSDPAVVPAFSAWTIAGRSMGWGMHLRRLPARREGPRPEASLEVEGEATGPEAQVVRFWWLFTTELMFAHCLPAGRPALVLPEDGELEVHVVLDGKALFGSKLGTDAELRFAALAAADTDQDGMVTTDELLATTLEGVEHDSVGGVTNLHELLSARLASLVAPEYTCQVDAALAGAVDADEAEPGLP